MSRDGLESPFLEEELFVSRIDAEREARVRLLEAESPFRLAFESTTAYRPLSEREVMLVAKSAGDLWGDKLGNIDVYAQRAIVRLSKNPAAVGDAHALLEAVKSRELRGIFIENQKVPALRAQKLGTWYGKLIPPGEDAAVVPAPAGSAEPPLIAFRDAVKANPARLDPALVKASRELAPTTSEPAATREPAFIVTLRPASHPSGSPAPRSQPELAEALAPPGRRPAKARQLAQPSSLRANPTSATSVTLTWEDTENVGVDAYLIRRDTRLVGGTGGSTKRYRDTELTPGNAYQYSVVAADLAGSRSAEQFVSTTTPPAVIAPSSIVSGVARMETRPDGKPPYVWRSVLIGESPVLGAKRSEVVQVSYPADAGERRKMQERHPNIVLLQASPPQDITEAFARVAVEASFAPKTAKKLKIKETRTLSAVVMVHELKIKPRAGETPLRALERAFGIRIEAGDRAWSLADLVFMDDALHRLSLAERRVICGYRFVRSSAARGDQDPDGTHTCTEDGCTIELGDSAFDHPHLRQERMQMPNVIAGLNVLKGTFTILHEIGHAMDATAWRRGETPSLIVDDFANVDNPDYRYAEEKHSSAVERFASAFAVFKARKDRLRDDKQHKVLNWFNRNRHFRAGPYKAPAALRDCKVQ